MNYGAHTGHAHNTQVSTYGHPNPSRVLTPGPMTYRGPEDSLAPMSMADRTLHSIRNEVPIETQGARSVRSAVFMVSGFLIGVAACVLVMRHAMSPSLTTDEQGTASLAAQLPAAAEGLPPPKARPAAVPASRDLDMEFPEAAPAAPPAAPKAKAAASPKTTRPAAAPAAAPATKTATAAPVTPKAKSAPAPKYPSGSNKAEQDLMRQALAATASAL